PVPPPCTNAFAVNGNSGSTMDVVGPSWALTLDGTASTCTSHFVSIQLSDAAWNRYGTEGMKWLGSNDYLLYGGSIKHFNIKKFATDRGFQLSAGQYYLVKLAGGPSWAETTKLIHLVNCVGPDCAATPEKDIK